MVDEDDDIQSALNAALRDAGTVGGKRLPRLEDADAVEENELTSVMGNEERQLLQHAARSGSDETSSEGVRKEDHVRPTARPPASGHERPVIVGGEPEASTMVVRDERAPDASSAVESEASRRARRISRAWSIVAFLLLAAAAVVATRNLNGQPKVVERIR